MRAVRAIFLFVLALGLAWLAGWGLRGTELTAPFALASFVSAALAIAPRAARQATE